MTKRRIIIWLWTFILIWQGGFVEEVLLAQIVSPQVHADRRVTFRLKAPQAQQVAVQGISGLADQPMVKNAEGVWEATVGPLPPELYSYMFDVDGTVVTDPSNRQVKKWLTVSCMFEVPGDPPLLHELQHVPHGVVHHLLYDSQTTGTQRGVYVYTPPSYDPHASDRFPLVVLMHGYGDDESAWIEVGRAHLIADNLIAQGKIRPLVIAMPYGHPLPIDLQAKFDDYAGRNLVLMESEVLNDLLPQLENRYPLLPDRRQRAIVGLSMGGGQSLTIGLRHLDQFAWIGGFSSAAPQEDRNAGLSPLVADISGSNQQLGLLWIGCGKDDFLLQRNQEFVAWLQDKGVKHTYRETLGGHDWTLWRVYLAEFLQSILKDL